ncbi:MAG: hypothetical protein PVJ01_06855, partial [Pseudomonadota bacterium]
MASFSGKKGKELLLAVLEELKSVDPRIIPFDSDEIQNLEYSVVQGVRDVFGSESPEYSEFEGFRITAGNISRGDSRAEKQSKYELGLPKAVARVEEIISIIDRSEENMQDLSPGDLVEVKGGKQALSARPAPPKPVPRAKADSGGPPPSAKPETPSAPGKTSDAAPGPSRTEQKASGPSHSQPGKILLLDEGGGDISTAVTSLLEKIGIDIDHLDEDSSSEM